MNEFFDDIATFFAQLTDEETIVLGIFGLLLFALGIIVGWIIQSRTTKRYKKQLMLMQGERDLLLQRTEKLGAENRQFAQELEAMSRQKVEALDQIQGLRAEAATREQRVAGLEEQLAAGGQDQVTIDELNAVVNELRARGADLTTRLRAQEETNNQLRDELANVRGAGAGAGPLREGSRNVSFEEQSEGAVARNFTPLLSGFEQRFQRLEDRLIALAEENATLRAAGQTTTAPSDAVAFDDTSVIPADEVIPPPVATGPTGEPLVIRADTTEPGVRKGTHGDTEVVVTTRPSLQISLLETYEDAETDDLTRIDNIGPFLQRKLNEVDIYRYAQIAGWTEADITTYTELIGYLPGVIQKDDWIGQAQRLMGETTDEDSSVNSDNAAADSDAATGNNGPFGTRHTVAFDADALSGAAPDGDPTPTVAEADPGLPGAGANSTDEDDLKIVEGIGPKIETILKAHGILTLDQLANTEVEELRKILDDAGSRYRSHNPKTWAVQAGLAADGKLNELRAWQKELKNGR